jgi:hypothetical protein
VVSGAVLLLLIAAGDRGSAAKDGVRGRLSRWRRVLQLGPHVRSRTAREHKMVAEEIANEAHQERQHDVSSTKSGRW